MPAAATITRASKAAIAIVRLEGPRGFESTRRVPVLSIPDEVAGDREFCFERATIFYPPRAYHHYRLYIAFAAASAGVHPARFHRASSRLARAKVAANFARARSLAGQACQLHCAQLQHGHAKRDVDGD